MEAGLTVLLAFYDLEDGPVSFDFATWLVRARMEQEARGAKKLHVVVVPKEDGLGGFSRHWGKHDAAAAEWRLWSIVAGCCPLASATLTIAPSRWYAQALERSPDPQWKPKGKAHFMGPIVQASRGGVKIPKLRATDGARRYVASWLGKEARPVLTLTTRQQETDDERNSNLRAWDLLATHAERSGFRVVLLEDSNIALGKGRGYAEHSPDLRLALYERAAMNFIGNNGPQELLKFSDAPYRIFGLALSNGWKQHFRERLALEPGEQLPWANEHQRLIYEQDSEEVLIREFDEWRLPVEERLRVGA